MDRAQHALLSFYDNYQARSQFSDREIQRFRYNDAIDKVKYFGSGVGQQLQCDNEY